VLQALTSDRLRRVVYRSPWLHGLASQVAPLIYRDDGWGWHRIERGPAGGCWIAARPRTHKFTLAGSYEPTVVRYLEEHLRHGVLWDVGAHTGYMTLVAARLGAVVVAIEAHPDNASRLRSAVARNGLGRNVHVVESAVGSCGGVARLAPGGDSSTGRIADEGIEVPMTTLDELRSGYPAPTILKIDVEGFEAEVLRGGTALLTDGRPAVLIELHPWADAGEVYAQLGQFRLAELDAGHVLAKPDNGSGPQPCAVSPGYASKTSR
jgi:FkbM family methyltransferase